MWAYESVFYQIYPMGFVGAPFENDGVQKHGILKVIDWIPHIKKVGADAIYFSPVFESDTHGYNTRDYKQIDVRLGTNEDFKKVCEGLHENGIRIVLDGVFNHVGRGHFAFKDVLENRHNSKYLNWFNINLDGNSGYNDGLWYEGWEGNYDLVKLNLRNEEVINYIFDCVKFWIDYFDIDGIRLDVAYCLDEDFMRRLRSCTDSLKEDFFLLGEMVHGDYNRIVNDTVLHSATNYECYKGIFSSLNSQNLFEIMHSLLRQFGSEQWCLYRGKHLLSFVDNHDVSRIASAVTDAKKLPIAFALMYGMLGMPCIYYGSEWGTKADKSQGDSALRPFFENYEENELTDFIEKLSAAKKQSKALNYGDIKSIVLTNNQCVFSRSFENETVYVAVNISDSKYEVNIGCDNLIDMLEQKEYNGRNVIELEPYSAYFFKAEK